MKTHKIIHLFLALSALIAVQLTGCDSGSSSSDTIQPNQNLAPFFLSQAPSVAQINLVYNYDIWVLDVDGAAADLVISKSADDTCNGILTDNGDGTGNYTFTPNAAVVDTQCVVGLSASDGHVEVVQNTTVDIGDVNAAPYFTSTASITATEGSLYTYNIAVADDNVPAQTLTISLALFDTCGGSLIDNGDGTGVYSFTPGESFGGMQCLVGLTVTDSENSSADQFTLVSIAENNLAPSFASSAPNAIVENEMYLYPATVTDPDLPVQTLTCSINASDTCGGTLSSCMYIFTPTESQGGSSCVVGLTVTDNGSPVLSVDQDTTVNIVEVNSPPAFISLPTTSAIEGVLFTYTATVSDSDLPLQALTCTTNVSDTCGGSLTGCSYSFTPTESQGGTSCVMGMTVTDDGIPALNATQNTTVNILDTNLPPSFTSSGPTTAAEGFLYTYAATVADPDDPAQALVCSVSVSDTCGGVVAGCTYTFTPMELQGGAKCVVGLTVTDNGSPVLSATQNTTVDVSEINLPPEFTSSAPTSVLEGSLYLYSADVTDSDIPLQQLTCTINANDTCAGSLAGCLYLFAPTESHGGSSCVVGLTVTDNGSPVLSVDQDTTVNIVEVNSPPAFISLPTTSAIEGVSFTYTATVSDSDLPLQTLTCSTNVSDTCGGSLAGCSYSFTPTESQGGTSCVMGLTVTDDGIPALNASQNTTVNILDTNLPPSFTSSGPTTAAEGFLYTYAATVADPDDPVQALVCSVSSSDTCGGVVAGCTYTFTPMELQGGAKCVVGLTVTDNGSPALSATQNTTVDVSEINLPPEFTSSAPTSILEGSLYLYSADVTDSDIPLQQLTCAINANDTCAGMLAGCLYLFTPTESQGGSSCVVGLTVSDNGAPVLSEDQDTTVNIIEANSPPTFTSLTPTAASEGVLYTYNATVSDPDSPAQVLTCSTNIWDSCGGTLVGCSYTFTPTELDGGTNCVVGLTVTDNGSPILGTNQTTAVYIAEVNSSPSFTSSAPPSATEGVLYTYAASATDPDLPPQVLTCAKSGSDTCGGALAGCTYSFTPTEMQGGISCVVGLTVSDDGVPTMSANQNITVSVAEVNSSPSFTSTAPTSANEGALYTYAATVSDPDFPVQNLVCSKNVSDTCGGALAGCSYSFTPTEVQGGTSCVLGLTVTDDGSPVLNAIQNTTVNILETNSAPNITSTGSTSGTEGVLYSYAATVSDPDVPAQILTCSRSGTDTCGGTMTGCTYSFTPSESLGGGSCVVGITVTDNGTPVLSATQNTTVFITEINSAPSFTSSAPTTASEGVLYSYTALVTDPDLPAQTLTCSLSPANTCSVALVGCAYSFTPTESQGGSSCVVGITVTDNGVPVLNATQNTTVNISETNQTPVWSPAPSNITWPIGIAYNSTNGHATDADTPAQTLTCSKVSDNCSFGVTVSGSAAGAVNCNISFAAVMSAQSCTVNLQVSDGGGGTITSSVQITTQSCTALYVHDTATGAGTGLSWANAFTSIQSAVVAASFSPGCQVWVAGGTYFTGTNSSVITMMSGVEIYGGFAGTETSLAQRVNPMADPSILDGLNLSCHVVVGASNARLDGFTLTRGNGTGTCAIAQGGGLYNTGVSSQVIANCKFINNTSSSYGGAIENAASSTPTVVNCVFTGNTAQEGGGIDNDTSTPIVMNCSFSGNNGVNKGGGVNNYHSNPIITNCILWGNTSANGPDIYNDTSDPVSTPVVTYSDVLGGYTGTGNINSDPLFLGYPNLHIPTTSPCKNAGTSAGAPATDIEGFSRALCPGHDIGAYEYHCP